MKAGRLRHVIVIERLVTERDSDDEFVDQSWLPAFPGGSRLRAEVRALSGRELLAAQANQSKVTTRITIRFRPGFEQPLALRARLGQTVFNIEAAIPDEGSRNRHITLLTTSGVREG